MCGILVNLGTGRFPGSSDFQLSLTNTCFIDHRRYVRSYWTIISGLVNWLISRRTCVHSPIWVTSHFPGFASNNSSCFQSTSSLQKTSKLIPEPTQSLHSLGAYPRPNGRSCVSRLSEYPVKSWFSFLVEKYPGLRVEVPRMIEQCCLINCHTSLNFAEDPARSSHRISKSSCCPFAVVLFSFLSEPSLLTNQNEKRAQRCA